MRKSKEFKSLIGNMVVEWKWLLKFVYRYKLILLLYIVIGLVGIVMGFGAAISSKYLIDSVVSHSRDQLLVSGILVVGFALFQIFFQALSSWITSVVSTKADNEIKQEIYSHILKSEWTGISKFHTGDLLNRLENDVAVVSSAVINFIPGVFTKLFQFAATLAIVLYYDKTMAFLALLSAPFLVLSSRLLIKTIRKYSKLTREANGDILAFSEESVQNIQILKAFDLTRDYIENFRKILEDFRNVKLSYDKFSIAMTVCLSLIGMVVSYSCYGWGVYRLWTGAITYGTMTLFLQMSSSLTSSFSAIASLAPSSISIATAAGRIMEITSFSEECDEDKQKAFDMLSLLKNNEFELVFENISFSYKDKQQTVLKDISLSLKSGETVAFVGPSGEGKTTLFKLILGLIKPDSGRIYVKCKDEQINISDSTRRFCSYVPQVVNGFSGTIKENIRMVNADATDEQIIQALKKADLYDFIKSLPDGVNSVLNEQGANLSRGQLQRLTIARALVKNAHILLLDEATSALDVDTETTVLKNIMEHNERKMCLLTTHRESMLKYCDKIYRISADGHLIYE